MGLGDEGAAVGVLVVWLGPSMAPQRGDDLDLGRAPGLCGGSCGCQRVPERQVTSGEVGTNEDGIA